MEAAAARATFKHFNLEVIFYTWRYEQSAFLLVVACWHGNPVSHHPALDRTRPRQGYRIECASCVPDFSACIGGKASPSA
ncbi:hypothetical protein SRHO_G00068890 [Serrasalmus rhombeus]